MVLENLYASVFVPEWHYAAYALFSVVTIAAMTYSFLATTLIQVGTLKKFQHVKYEDEARLFAQDRDDYFSREVTSFSLFWKSTCEKDWYSAVHSFHIGIPSFLVSIMFGTWLKFLPLLGPGIAVTIVCSVTMLALGAVYWKWGKFLTSSTT